MRESRPWKMSKIWITWKNNTNRDIYGRGVCQAQFEKSAEGLQTDRFGGSGKLTSPIMPI